MNRLGRDTISHPVRCLNHVRMFMLLVSVVVAAAVSRAQVGTPIPSKFPDPDEKFEVASVKPNRSGSTQWDFDALPGRVTGTNVLLRDLIR